MGTQFPNVPSANGVGTPSCGHGECSSNFLNHPPETRLQTIASQNGFQQTAPTGRHASGQLTSGTTNYFPRHDDSEDDSYYQDESGNDLRY